MYARPTDRVESRATALEILATDMKPYDVSVSTVAAWLPVMDRMPKQKPPQDRQEITNVLQDPAADGSYVEVAQEAGVPASGWSWSSKFGDLDADGFVDLYVVNGMIDSQNLGHLDGGELVEENRAFRNQGDGTFVPANDWGLGAIESGRGMSMGDMDDDGDLDVVVNNLADRATLFENRLCGGDSLQVDLAWPGHGNPSAVGARLALVTSAGTFRRDVTVGSGYLSGDPARQHFGVPRGATVERLVVGWPDGTVSVVDRPDANSMLTITRQAT